MNLSKIHKNLWLGNKKTAVEYMFDTNICTAGESTCNYTPRSKRTKLRKVIMRDTKDTSFKNFIKHMEQARHYLKQELDRGHTVQLHCYAGINRSCSSIVYYAMTERGIPFSAARDMIREAKFILDQENAIFTSHRNVLLGSAFRKYTIINPIFRKYLKYIDACLRNGIRYPYKT